MFKNTQDETLLSDCKIAVQTEKQSTARVLEYLAEIDKRRLWIKEGYSSLYDFCIRYLNYSEGETHRRVQACRLTSRVEAVKPLLEQGSLSLTAMSLLSPVLDNENAKDILPKVINQPSRRIEKVLQEHFPETKQKETILKVTLDEELERLLEEAKRLTLEKAPAELLRKVLRHFVREKKPRAANVKHHTRYVSKPLAREIKQRDGFQCTFVSIKGIRCNQTAHLEVDHIQAWAKGGSSLEKDNLRLLCRAHNLYFQKRDFPDFKISSKKRDSQRRTT